MVWAVFDKASEKLPIFVSVMHVPEMEERLTLGAERIPEGATARRDFALDEELVAVCARESDPFVHLVVIACLVVKEHEKSEQ